MEHGKTNREDEVAAWLSRQTREEKGITENMLINQRSVRARYGGKRCMVWLIRIRRTFQVSGIKMEGMAEAIVKPEYSGTKKSEESKKKHSTRGRNGSKRFML